MRTEAISIKFPIPKDADGQRIYICSYCLKPLSNRRRKYCSEYCSDMAAIESNPHSVYAREALERHLNKVCPICEVREWGIDNGWKQIHHITPIVEGGDNKVENLVFLHTKCHVAIGNARRLHQKIYAELETDWPEQKQGGLFAKGEKP